MGRPDLSPLEADRIIRKGVTEYLQVASSFEAQRQYDREVPDFVDVPAEMIEMWADCFPDDPRQREFTAAFTSDEVQAVREFHATRLTVTGAIRKRQRATQDGRHGTLVEVQALPEWDELRVAAETALRHFRGGHG